MRRVEMTSEAVAITAGPGAPHFLVHNQGDDVGVAVQDVGAGVARARYMDTEGSVELDVREGVPLGHKVALTDIAAGADVIEYGERIGRATAAIGRGELVHVHNLGSARWERSR
jgi:(2R)-sulfolactate sulfo-lyase subunit alpha